MDEGPQITHVNERLIKYGHRKEMYEKLRSGQSIFAIRDIKFKFF